MSEDKPRRGRPRGTGIDDSDRIARLAELIRVKPGLKPTTAIRAMGIADPSIIRRLRDKYSVYLRETEAQVLNMPRAAAPAVRPAAPAEANSTDVRH